jgi:hypothetical protein
LNSDRLRAGGAVTALVSGPIGARDSKTTRAITGAQRIRDPGDSHRAGAIIRCDNAVWIRNGYPVATANYHTIWTTDGRRGSIMDCYGLGACRAVAALIGPAIRASNNELPRAIARGNHIVDPRDAHCSSAVISRDDSVCIWRRNLAGAAYGQIGRAGHARGIGVLNGDGLGASGAVAARIGCSIGAGDHELAGAIT